MSVKKYSVDTSLLLDISICMAVVVRKCPHITMNLTCSEHI